MRTIASWLTARPVNTVLGLALSLMLPFAQVLSGAVMVTAMLALGTGRTALRAGAALLLLAALFALLGNAVPQLVANALVAWLPAALLALLMRRSGSLTLTLQVSVIAAIAITVGFHALVGDPVAFWEARLAELAAAFAGMGLDEQAALLSEQSAVLAPQMTMLFVLVSWSLTALVLALGHTLYQELPDARGRYGRFCDVNLGRVLAFAMAVASVLALLSNAAWLQTLAFVMFVVFWVQGLAIMHWLQSDGPLPVFALVAVYALLPVLNLLLVTALAVLGYTDAWFDYRTRMRAARAKR